MKENSSYTKYHKKYWDTKKTVIMERNKEYQKQYNKTYWLNNKEKITARKLLNSQKAKQ